MLSFKTVISPNNGRVVGAYDLENQQYEQMEKCGAKRNGQKREKAISIGNRRDAYIKSKRNRLKTFQPHTIYYYWTRPDNTMPPKSTYPFEHISRSLRFQLLLSSLKMQSTYAYYYYISTNNYVRGSKTLRRVQSRKLTTPKTQC